MSLRTQLQTAQARYAEIGDEMTGIGSVAEAEARDMNDEEMASIESLGAESKVVQARIQNLEKAVAAANEITRQRELPAKLDIDQTPQKNGTDGLPARVRNVKSTAFASNLEAYNAGQWLRAKLLNNGESKRWINNYGMPEFRAAMEGGTDTLGGFAVPDPLAATIIELVEEWGVFRRNARNVTMTSDTLDIPKLDASLQVKYPAEGDAIVASDLTLGQVNLLAKKYAQLAIMSTELNEDAVISMTDLLARDMARNYAHAEDLNSFLGDGSATYGGITGVQNALNAGAILTGGSTFGALTKDIFEQAAGKIKQYAGITPKWYISRYGYYNSMIPILTDLGGTDMRHVEGGGDMMFLGYPVEFTQVLVGETGTTGDMACVFGDLDLGAYLGTRRQVSIRVLNELYAANDQIGVISTMRSDTQVHSLGDATEAGAIVAIELGV